MSYTEMKNKAAALGWEIVGIKQSYADEYVVMVKRSSMPIERAYSTHKYSDMAKSFYYGHYDMSQAAATKSLEER